MVKGVNPLLSISRTPPGILMPVDLAKFMKQNEPQAYSTEPARLRYDPLVALSHARAISSNPRFTYSANNLRVYQNEKVSYSNDTINTKTYETLRKQLLSYSN